MTDENGNWLMCSYSGKRCYSQVEAGSALNGAKHHQNRRNKVPARKYFCEHCHCYHLTSQTFTKRYKSDKHRRRYIKTIK